MLHVAARILGYCRVLSICAAVATITTHVAKSSAQSKEQGQIPASATASTSDVSPIFGIAIPAGYRDWKLVSVAREKGSLNDIRAVLGNDLAIKAYRCRTRQRPCHQGVSRRDGIVPGWGGHCSNRLDLRPVGG
jgi:hypothetical protein